LRRRREMVMVAVQEKEEEEKSLFKAIAVNEVGGECDHATHEREEEGAFIRRGRVGGERVIETFIDNQ